MGVSKNRGKTPQNGCFIMENLFLNGWFGGSTIFGNIHMIVMDGRMILVFRNKLLVPCIQFVDNLFASGGLSRIWYVFCVFPTTLFLGKTIPTLNCAYCCQKTKTTTIAPLTRPSYWQRGQWSTHVWAHMKSKSSFNYRFKEAMQKNTYPP